MAAGQVVYVQICTINAKPCPNPQQDILQAYLIDPTFSAEAEIMLSQSGIDWTAVYDSFGLCLLMFAVGLGCGLISNVVKRNLRF